jgi:hypothetical protein
MPRLLKVALVVAVGALLSVAVSLFWPAPAGAATGTGTGPELASIGPIAFGPDGTLFLADNRAASIFALDTQALGRSGEPGAAAVDSVGQKVAAMLGTDGRSITITDLAVHPSTRNVFLSVARNGMTGGSPAVFRIDGAGAIELVGLERASYSRVTLPNPPRSLMGRGARVDTVTDMALVDGRLWVAGLSNEEFSSKLRAIPYPFTRTDGGVSVEIYHGSHGAYETRSPVYTFVPYSIDGEPHLIAGYLCTPLVTFPLAALEAGGKIRGTTVAELGNMNRPLDMIVYRKDGRDFVLMSNNSRGVMKIPADAFRAAAAITAPVAGVRAGIRYETIAAMQNVDQLDLLDADRAVVLARRGDAALDLRLVPLP